MKITTQVIGNTGTRQIILTNSKCGAGYKVQGVILEFPSREGLGVGYSKVIHCNSL
jgi:hypothetical protein